MRPSRRAATAIALLGALAGSARAQEGAVSPHWIWSARPADKVYLRKSFTVGGAQTTLALDVAADNGYTLTLDGKPIASGANWQAGQSVRAKLGPGDHVLAAVVTNDPGSPGGFLLRGLIQPPGRGRPVHSDATWKATDKEPIGDAWTKPGFVEAGWEQAKDLGALGVGPWGNLAFEGEDTASRYKVPEGFKVTQVAAHAVSGSAIAFAFDPKGRPVVSVERGPLARLVDEDADGTYDARVVVAPQMSNCQGFSFIDKSLYAVGDGPGGKTGIFKLDDPDGDGVFQETRLVREAVGGMGEHGPHSVQPGPDGFLYFNAGNHAHLGGPIDPRSPATVAYEGELLPHYNDSRGHAAGIMAPGGEIYRSADEGRSWERVAQGFRNEYDFAFNRDGEIFSFDSDMEWDIGLPWYRPVRVTHCPPGAEFGWRNGSGKWAPYFFDSLPGILDLGRGSPTGVTFYQGDAFPAGWDDNFLICDWSQGRILAVELKRQGASYVAKPKELVSGQPLNCTDIEVGPDGAVYFTTGGRGTTGGLFKVAWTGKLPPKPPSQGIFGLIGMPSPQSAFSRAKLDALRAEAGGGWGQDLLELARGPHPGGFRCRALDILTEYGPPPSVDLLVALTKDVDAQVRAKAVLLLGMRPGTGIAGPLGAALADKDPFVRRRACEALVRSRSPIPGLAVVRLLDDPDRFVRFAARNALEHATAEVFDAAAPLAKPPRSKLEVMLARVRRGKLEPGSQDRLFAEELALMKGELDLVDYLDLLRLVGLTYLRGDRAPAAIAATAGLRAQLVESDYPFVAKHSRSELFVALDREIARLLAYLDEPRAVALIGKAQATSTDRADQIHCAYALRALTQGWTPAEKARYWAWFEGASRWDGGFSYLGYLDFMLQDFLPRLSPAERVERLDQGHLSPFPTRVLVRSMDLDADPNAWKAVTALYGRLPSATNPAASAELAALILEKLGRSATPGAHKALREVAAADPSKRDLVARALASKPTADDLPTLASALESRDINTTSVVLAALRRLDAKPEGPDAPRALIRLARRLGPSTRADLDAIASRWLGVPASPESDWNAALSHWEASYAKAFPDALSTADTAPVAHAYTLEELVAGALKPERRASASADRGRVVLAKARCLECHKYGDQGQGLGPELTTLSSRFPPADILESIALPSKVISDQYKSTTIATTDGKVYNGMPAGGDAQTLVLLLSDGTKASIPRAEIDEQRESKVSVMPGNLLDPFSMQDVADLIALFESAPRVEALPKR